MKTPTGLPVNRQPWCPGHWLTLTGYALDPTDLHAGTNQRSDSRRRIVATVLVDHAINKMMGVGK